MLNRLKRLKNQSEIVFNSRFLSNLNAAERYEFLQLCHSRNYKEGEFVFYKGDPGTGMYFIEEGRIELSIKTVSDSDSPGDYPHLELASPDSFGALSIGYDLRRRSSARCITECKLLGFFKPDFEVLKDRHPKIAVKFLQTLANIALRQLDTTTKKLAEISDEDTALGIQFKTYYEDQQQEESV